MKNKSDMMKKYSKSWEPRMMFVASIIVIIMVLIELVNAIILTHYGVRSLKEAKYTLMHESVVVNVPPTGTDEKKVLADMEDLPKVQPI
jgi:hypothetical protein